MGLLMCLLLCANTHIPHGLVLNTSSWTGHVKSFLCARRFPRDQCEGALQRARGNQDVAASLLFGDGMF